MAATIVDHIVSQNLVVGILAVLVARDRTGRGQRGPTSLLLGSQMWAQASENTGCRLTGSVPGARQRGQLVDPGHLRLLPHVRWMDRDRRRGRSAGPRSYTKLLGRPDLTTDPRFPPTVDGLSLSEMGLPTILTSAPLSSSMTRR